jgi:hypothetical protein
MPYLIAMGYAFVGWALCGAIIGIGRKVTSLQRTLIIHAIGAPLIFALLAFHWFSLYHYFSPLQTAALFTGFVIAMDALLVAPIFEKSFAMFASLLGTWIPFTLIFVAIYLVGTISRGG